MLPFGDQYFKSIGFTLSKRGSEEKSLKYLLEAKTIYENYKANNSVRPLDFEEIFTMENASSRNWSSFEKTFTHTLFYMAQVYEHLKDGAKTAEYCKETLRRQLEFKDYDRIEWTANCTTLSLYFVQEKLFPEARHLLCCSQYLLSDCRPEPTMDRRIADQQRDQIRNSKAFVATCWAKYCNAVLAEPQNPEKDCKNIPQIDRFINVWPLVIQESEIPCQIKNYDEARAVFLWGIKCIDAAKSYFRLNEYATNYSQLVEEHSKLFKNLAGHDPDLNRQCKMHKRRMDQLTALVRSLNPQFYMSLCRQLQFELGEICHEMIHLKTRIANETIEGISISKAAKISSLATQGISHFENFINTFKDKEGKLPDTFSEDNVRPILIAHFYIGRYCSKLLETDPNNKEHNLSKLKEYFTFVVKYIEANPDHASTIENELPLAKEMLEYMTERANQVVMSATS
ncbi:KIF-binding protein [Caerostris extrusa]|uniref:KIF-binding protein n=1 Tax=Caerostris extrusa TaxID=172846 RepID=A0AAV4WWL7_CAEEX|nr:KIF-binding protein [Caerostris extrusa]